MILFWSDVPEEVEGRLLAMPKRIRRHGTTFNVIISKSYWKMTICLLIGKAFIVQQVKNFSVTQVENVL